MLGRAWSSVGSGGPYTLRWDRKLKAGLQSVVLSFDRFDTTTFSADVDNCACSRARIPHKRRGAARNPCLGKGTTTGCARRGGACQRGKWSSRTGITLRLSLRSSPPG